MAKVAPVGAWVGDPLSSVAGSVGSADSADSRAPIERVSSRAASSARGLLSRRYGQKAEEYAALLSKVTRRCPCGRRLVTRAGGAARVALASLRSMRGLAAARGYRPHTRRR